MVALDPRRAEVLSGEWSRGAVFLVRGGYRPLVAVGLSRTILLYGRPGRRCGKTLPTNGLHATSGHPPGPVDLAGEVSMSSNPKGVKRPGQGMRVWSLARARAAVPYVTAVLR